MISSIHFFNVIGFLFSNLVCSSVASFGVMNFINKEEHLNFSVILRDLTNL